MKFICSLTISIALFCMTSMSALADPALVEVSDEDTTIYILGTVHALRPGVEWQSDEIDRAFQASEAIYFETDMWSPSAQGMMAQVLIRGLNPQGVTLSATMSKEAWRVVAAYASQHGLPEQGLERMQPWLASLVLGSASQSRSGVELSEGVDQQLLAQSIKQSRELRHFNSAEEQVRFLSDLPLEIQSAMLLDTVRQREVHTGLSDGLLNAWLSGDLDTLDAIVNRSMREFSPELFEVIIVGRNASWVEELTSLMEVPGVYFVAVGAAHLPGDYGLIELMRAQGFDVSAD